jgi:hypothetical protein
LRVLHRGESLWLQSNLCALNVGFVFSGAARTKSPGEDPNHSGTFHRFFALHDW